MGRSATFMMMSCSSSLGAIKIGRVNQQIGLTLQYRRVISRRYSDTPVSSPERPPVMAGPGSWWRPPPPVRRCAGCGKKANATAIGL